MKYYFKGYLRATSEFVHHNKGAIIQLGVGVSEMILALYLDTKIEYEISSRYMLYGPLQASIMILGFINGFLGISRPPEDRSNIWTLEQKIPGIFREVFRF